MTKQIKPNSTITAGGLSTAAIGVIEKLSLDEPLSGSMILLCPFLVSMVVWFITRVMARIEPFSEVEAKELSKIGNGIRELDRMIKKELNQDDLKFLKEERKKLISRKTEIQLSKSTS
ncbi:hypothetical protein J8Z24_18350 [Pseudoalteromonas sp. SCSIO 43201]|uniref:hypothetical protein n=1 Tax=Pseudoalteromonas sp. SCSIO 43201 TaxID=2822842 RepID=UPI00207619BE|nr:hypothetical protein [Pseudoalteromonas sp. SCSIO 43201]USD30922.1 hypothetical protein J8Z24_18350 [Pseudoalteromonas sp. SCSIO 43201]